MPFIRLPFFLLVFKQIADFRQQLDIRWRRGSVRRFFHLFERQFAHTLDYHENRKRDNDEIDCHLDKIAVIDGNFWCDNRAAVHDSRFDHVFEIVEMNASDQKAKQGHQNIADERRNDFAEGGTDNDTDSHIDDIAAQGKRFEFFECFFHGDKEKKLISRVKTGPFKRMAFTPRLQVLRLKQDVTCRDNPAIVAAESERI